ncbi:MAG: hypothetical protein ACR2N3_05070 [Pyrinomonadaceae bacterium]
MNNILKFGDRKNQNHQFNLKDCPFCIQSAQCAFQEERKTYLIGCKDMNCRGFSISYAVVDLEEGIELWNTRADEWYIHECQNLEKLISELSNELILFKSRCEYLEGILGLLPAEFLGLSE